MDDRQTIELENLGKSTIFPSTEEENVVKESSLFPVKDEDRNGSHIQPIVNDKGLK